MKYFSTRNKSLEFSFKDIFLRGLAPDGGLFLPSEVRQYNQSELKNLSKLSYVNLATEIIFNFCKEDVDKDQLKTLIEKAYGNFKSKEVGKYFEQTYPDPFMLKVYKVKEEKRERIPAVVHKDGTGRLQTVSYEINPRYHSLISKFYEITGIPILLNTSFNENEPVVCTPKEALNCFLRTNMDVIILNNFMIKRDPNRNISKTS